MQDFIDPLNVAAGVWVPRIWAVLWQSTLVAAAVALVAGLFLRRSSPSVRCWVWQILAFKILLMPFWTYALLLPKIVKAKSAERVAVSVPDANRDAPLPTAQRPLSADSPPLADAWVLPRITWQTWLFCGWGAIVLGQIVRLLRKRTRILRILRQSLPADDALAAALREASERLGVRHAPQAVLTDVNCSPFVCGIRRAVVVLPRSLAASLTTTELNHVLLHELAHVRRRDLLWGWAGELARVVYFFHPVVHWICLRLRLERELACDAIAMSLSGWNAVEYAATLVQVVSHTSKPALFNSATALAGASPQLNTFWKRRLTMLPSLSQAANRATRSMWVFLGVLSVVVLALPTLEVAAEPQEAVIFADALSDAEARAKPARTSKEERTSEFVEYLPRPTKFEEKMLLVFEKPTTVEFLDLPLEDCFHFLKEYHHINIWLDRAKLTEEGVALDQPVTLSLAGVSFRSVLKLLLEPVQLTYLIDNEVMMITTSAKAGEKLITRTYPVRDLYQGRIKGEATSNRPDKGDPKGALSTIRSEDLEAAITKSIDPGSWHETKGPGSITFVKESGAFVIRHTQAAHGEILQLLRDLREAKRMPESSSTGKKAAQP